jgi:hypothetical protein
MSDEIIVISVSADFAAGAEGLSVTCFFNHSATTGSASSSLKALTWGGTPSVALGSAA